MSTWRFWTGFTILVFWLFGWLGVGVVLLITGHLVATFVVWILVWVSAKALPGPVAWLVTR